ncbi:uncharacterized protein [Rutidosis leptorrhynchoides]|uniref:uncharacterized protein isoform X2 n=1 Tax=Rutidosis leptorrhynchoides TaxID=125765 RepID=UPI003A995E03
MVAVKEAIVICIDNSEWMRCFDNRYSYNLQLNCVRSYCRAKLKSNPKNAIGLVAMGREMYPFEPTCDLDKILHQIKHSLGGSVIESELILSDYSDDKYLKRIIIFVGGPINLGIEQTVAFGKGLKKDGVAVDVVNFCPKEWNNGYWVRVFDAFVAAANNNNNSHIKHVRPHAWTLSTDVLSRNPEIVSGASLEEEEIRCLETKTPPTTRFDEHVLAANREFNNNFLAEFVKQQQKRDLELELDLEKLGKHKELDNKCKTVGVEQPGKHKELDNTCKTVGVEQPGKHNELDNTCKTVGVEQPGKRNALDNTCKTLGVEQPGKHKKLEKEAIVICIDNSEYMKHLDNRYSYNLQLNCVRSYCRAKFKSNPKNAIGLVAMGREMYPFEPTCDLDKILHQIKHSLGAGSEGGKLDFTGSVIESELILSDYSDDKYLKRIIIFVGGPINLGIEQTVAFGKGLKKDGVAVDVVNFCPKEWNNGYWVRVFDAFVAAANNNNNSHIKHVRPHAWTLSTDVLSRNPEIVSGASLEEEEIRCLETKTPPTTRFDEHVLAANREFNNNFLAEFVKQQQKRDLELELDLEKLGKHKELDNKCKTVGVEQPGKHKELDNTCKTVGVEQPGKHMELDNTCKTVGVEQPGKHMELDNTSSVSNSTIIISISSKKKGKIASERQVEDVNGKKDQADATYDDDDDDDDGDDVNDEYVEALKAIIEILRYIYSMMKMMTMMMIYILSPDNVKVKRVGKGVLLMMAAVCYSFMYSLG